MDTLWIVVSLLLRWAHVLPAAILVGAAFFARIAVVPSLEELPDDQRIDLREDIARRWSVMVMLCAGLLLITGIVNGGINISQYNFEVKGLYHGLWLLKFILALIVFYIASMLSGASESAKEFRNSTKFYLTVNCWLAVALVLVGGGMKLIDRTKKVPGETVVPVVAPDSPSPT